MTLDKKLSNTRILYLVHGGDKRRTENRAKGLMEEIKELPKSLLEKIVVIATGGDREIFEYYISEYNKLGVGQAYHYPYVARTLDEIVYLINVSEKYPNLNKVILVTDNFHRYRLKFLMKLPVEFLMYMGYKLPEYATVNGYRSVEDVLKSRGISVYYLFVTNRGNLFQLSKDIAWEVAAFAKLFKELIFRYYLPKIGEFIKKSRTPVSYTSPS